MATRLTLLGDAGTLTVVEDLDAMHSAFTGATSNPIQLTEVSGGEKVFVNPQAIAYWKNQPTGGASFS